MWENTDQKNSKYGHFSRSDCHLDFNLLYENNNAIIPETIYLSPLNKEAMSIYEDETRSKIYPYLNPKAPEKN